MSHHRLSFLFGTFFVLIFMLCITVSRVNAASWSFETTNDSAPAGDWDGTHVGTPAYATIELDTSIKNEGTGSYHFNNNHVCPTGSTDFYVHKKFTTTGKHYTVRAWYRWSGFPRVQSFNNEDVLVIFAPESTPESANPDDWYYLLNVTIDPTAHLRVGTYNDTSATSSQTISVDTWYDIQIDLFEDATNGSFSLKVDGTEWLSGSGLDTTDSFEVSANRILAVGAVAGKCYTSTDYDIWADDVRWYRGSTAYSASPTSTPTPAATDTPTPTNTPTPTTASSSSSQSSSSSGTPDTSCKDLKPAGTPDLFQIDAHATDAVLHFAPIVDKHNTYAAVYGYTSGGQNHGVVFAQGPASGALTYTINSLAPNTTYFIKLRAGNGCRDGDWGNEMQFTTTSPRSTQEIKYYKNVVTKVFSFLPRKTTAVAGASTQKINNRNTCTYTVNAGDTLWDIAQTKLGDATKYPEIMKSNGLATSALSIGQHINVACDK